MPLLLSVALLVQVGTAAQLPDRQGRDTLRVDTARVVRVTRVNRDSVRAWRDSVANARALRRRAERARTLTPEVLRASFANDATRELYLRARAARLQQDSALVSYDATTYQRVSAGLGFSRIGRDRLFFRHENAARVRWHRHRGAWVEVKGSRTVVPGLRGIREAEREMQSEFASEASPEMAPIPYYPGREGMWIGGGLAKAEVEDEEIVHPLAEGAETHYRFTAGDSMSIRTGDGKRFLIRELKVQARQPRWNLIVGSMWFDTESGRLVRAVYRLAEPLNAFEVAKEIEGEDPRDDIPIWVRPLVTPIVGSLDVVTVEYGLYEGRFWLPRVQRAEGHARVSFMRVPFTMEESYRYGSVNGRLDSLPVLRTAEEMQRMRDSTRAFADSITKVRHALRADTTEAGRARLAAFDSLRREARRAQREVACADGLLTTNEERYEGAVRVSLSVPCDASGLATAPELPASPYDPGDALFGANELEELRKTALSLVVQPGFAPQALELDYGVERWRYNRVEGFSPAASVRQRYGAGYVGELQARIGLADLQPNAELTIARVAGRRTVQVAGYRRLAAANDFGNPLGFGSSLAAVLFGRDEGFYYRTAGAELQATGEGNPFFTLRFFAERHDAAGKKTDLALPHLFNSGDFQDNIVADEGMVTGAGLRMQGSRGEDPQGFRLLGDLRAEGAGGAWLYGRTLGDVTLSRGFGARAAGALTLAGGMAGGDVPVQRQFFLGGSQTVRGQAPGAMRGDAFWMTRAEVGAGFVVARPTVFFDMGWAGDRGLARAGTPDERRGHRRVDHGRAVPLRPVARDLPEPAHAAGCVRGGAVLRAGARRSAFGGVALLTALTAVVAASSARAQPSPSSVVGDLRIDTLRSRVFGNTRAIRVLLPRGYDAPEQRGRVYPVLYLHDGQNLFDRATSTFNPDEWEVDETVARLTADGTVRPMIVVGIDHAGRRGRAHEYLPWPDAFLDPPDPTPEGVRHPAFLVDEVLPFVEARYRVARRPAHRVLGGSSYGALAALYAATARPGVFGGLLLESPSFYVADGRVFGEVRRTRALPSRVYLGVGTNEMGGASCTRADEGGEAVHDVRRLERALRARGLRARAVRAVVEPCARHDERAWARRLPDALAFLMPR